MSREARLVIPGAPHHITQRGNRRGLLFYNDQDRERFISWLAEACDRWGLIVLAYCLMSNHFHLEGIPANEESLCQVLKSVFTKYAMRLNSIHGWSGYVVQGRFYSSPLDDRHAKVVRYYIEENPVRARMVEQPEEYRWSSAYARARGIADPLVDFSGDWHRSFSAESPSLPSHPGTHLDEDTIARIRKLHLRNLPIGSDEYVQALEASTGRKLRIMKRGRPPKSEK